MRKILKHILLRQIIVIMSAAAGISAAKKRRGVVSTGPEPSQNTARPQTAPNGKPVQGQQQGASPMFTPIQILQNHELRLKNVEKQLNDGASSQPQQQQQAPQQQSNIQDAKLKYYTDKCEALEKKVEELSQLIQKVQTFSMESNLAFLKLKRVFDEDFEQRIQILKQSFTNENESNIPIHFSNVNVKNAEEALSSMSAV
jgi:hypothetical protein